MIVICRRWHHASRMQKIRGAGSSCAFNDERSLSKIDFKAIELKDKPVFDKACRARRYENSHYNFTNWYMWRNAFDIRWAMGGDVLYELADMDGRLTALQPLGKREDMQQAIGALQAYFKEHGAPLRFFGVDEEMKDELLRYSKDVKIEDFRDGYDYVYDAEKLRTLSGRKYHGKKNHLNAFCKNYPQAEYMPITADIAPACIENIHEWYKVRHEDMPDNKYLTMEKDAAISVLENFDAFQVKGGAIFLDGRVVACTFGEQLNDDTAVIHIEKADPFVRGAYTAINQMFVEHEWGGMKYINREEDMGLPGLRRAKETYKPVMMVKKYNAVLA